MTPPAPGAVLAVDGLRFGYPGRPLFAGWSLRIPPGVTLVRGGDGRGKTTLLRLLAGDLRPQAGEIRLGAVALHDRPDAYRQQVFWTDPRSGDFDRISAIDWFASQRARWPAFDAARLDAIVDGLALGPHVEKPLYMLSTGSRRKVWLAAAFAAGAPLTLIDDPFGALDRPSVLFVAQRLAEAARDGRRACVVSAHESPRDVPLAAVVDLGD